MQSRSWARIAVNAAGALAGAALVSYAAHSRLFLTNRAYGIPSVKFAWLLVPEALCAIGGALAGLRISRRLRWGQLMLIFVGAALIALGILVASYFARRSAIEYPMLLAGAAVLGAGLGLAVPALTVASRELDPLHPERAVLQLNSWLAVGALAVPVVEFLQIRAGLRWQGPVILAIVIATAGTAVHRLSARVYSGSVPPAPAEKRGRLAALGLTVLGYAVCVVFLVNWSQLHNITASGGQLAPYSPWLAAFWMPTLLLARLPFGILDAPKARRGAGLAPFMALGLVIATALVTHHYAVAEVGIYLVAAVGCASLLPISAHAGDEDLTVLAIVAAITVGVLYQIALGTAATSAGALEGVGLSPAEIFGMVGMLGLTIAVGCLAIARSLSVRFGKAPGQ